jgi:acetolactate synthase small subunit
MLQIETIVAAPTKDPARAVITFVVDTDDYGTQRITTGLAKIVEVISINHSQDATGSTIESAIVHFSDGASSKRAASNPDSLLIHASGNPQAMDRFLKLLEKAERKPAAR